MIKPPYSGYYKNLFASAFFGLFLLGCNDNNKEPEAALSPVSIEAGDECHLCGMIITNFPGPKGEAIEGKHRILHKFCSTRDLLSWYLQPENKPNTKAIFVHAMENTDWNQPDNSHMIPAQEAWFVKGSSKMGAMGPTLASFSSQQAAENFIKDYQGTLVRFEDITIHDLMGDMKHHH